MAYTDYLPIDGKTDLANPVNPFWYNTLQYIPIEYKGIDIDSHLALLNKPDKKAEMPDLSKFKEKLDKDVLYGEKSAVFEEFNRMEREIREELQKNPYALSNNPDIIAKFNKLTTLYNSPELQSMSDKKKNVEAQKAEVTKSGELEAFAYDAETGEYTPYTKNQIYEGFLNNTGKDNIFASLIFGNPNQKGMFRQHTISNTGKGTTKDFTNELQERYKQVEKDTKGDKTEIGGFTFVDGYGNRSDAAMAQGYVSTITGEGGTTTENLTNLKNVAIFLTSINSGLGVSGIETILGEKAAEGYKQEKTRLLNNGKAIDQFNNIENLFANIKMFNDTNQLSNDKTNPYENPYSKIYEEQIKPIIENINKDENMSSALSKVSTQKLIYDIKAFMGVKPDGTPLKDQKAKQAILMSNPVLKYLFQLEQEGKGELAKKYLQDLQQMTNIVEKVTSDALLAQNNSFNFLLNKSYSVTSFYENKSTPHGGFGQGAIDKENMAAMSEFQRLLLGYVDEENLKNEEVDIETYAIKLSQANKNISKEQALDLAIREAARQDMIKNSTGLKKDMAVFVNIYQNEKDPEKKKKLLEEMLKHPEINGNIEKYNKLREEYNENVEKRKNDFYTDLRRGTLNGKGGIKIKSEEVTGQTKLDSELGKLNAGLGDDALIQGSQTKGLGLKLNGRDIPASLQEKMFVENKGINGKSYVIPDPVTGLNTNIVEVQRTAYIPVDLVKEENEDIKNFLMGSLGIKGYDEAATWFGDDKLNFTKVNLGKGGDKKEYYAVPVTSSITRSQNMITGANKNIQSNLQGKDPYTKTGENVEDISIQKFREQQKNTKSVLGALNTSKSKE